MRKKMMILMLAGSIASSSMRAKTDFISTYHGTKGVQALIESGLQAFQSGANLIFTGIHPILKFMKHPQQFLAKRYLKLKNKLDLNMQFQQIGLSKKQLRRLQRRAKNLKFNIKFIEKIFPKMRIIKKMGKIKKNLREIESITGKMPQ